MINQPPAHDASHLQLKDIPDAIDANQDKPLRGLVVFVQELHQDIEAASADKHLQRQRGSLIHLPHKRRRLEPDLVGILPRSELGDDRDAAHKAQVFLQLDIIQDDLYPSAFHSINPRQDGSQNPPH